MKPLPLVLASVVACLAALPQRVVVGYWENWNTTRLPDIHPGYNVVMLAFATTRDGTDHDLRFDLPGAYLRNRFLYDLDSLHKRGTTVILSVGGASDPVRLTTDAQRDRFVYTLDSILIAHQDRIDGIDLDFESTSMDFGPWTLEAPAAGQTRVVDAVKTVMRRYRERTGRKLLLTMAPEVVYMHGGMSRWQTDNAHGGAWLPVIEGLRDSLDLLMPQLYNAGGASGGVYARDGKVWYDSGDPDFVTSMVETIVAGFKLLDGRGTFRGLPDSLIAPGLPASSCDAAGSGYVKPDSLALALRYLRGEIARPAPFAYSLVGTYPRLRGVMTWSIDIDRASCDGNWSFVEAATKSVAPTGIAPRSGAIGPVRTGQDHRDLLGRARPDAAPLQPSFPPR